MAYDDADYSIRREQCMAPTTAGATTEAAKFRTFQAMRLKKVHAAVITAGTSTAHGYDVYSGTTSVGTIAVGTAVAGSAAHSGLLDLSIATMAQVSVKSLADVVGVAQIVYEYEILPSAVQS
jgi:hypothetical protein